MPKIESRFSIGNLLTLVSVIVACAGGWFTLQANQNALSSKVLELKSDLRSVVPRVTALETQQAVTTAELRLIRRDIGEVKIDVRAMTSMMAEALSPRTK